MEIGHRKWKTELRLRLRLLDIALSGRSRGIASEFALAAVTDE
jgi:hypothetical protein